MATTILKQLPIKLRYHKQSGTCSTTFQLFYPKQKSKQSVWKSIMSQKAFKIIFKPGTTTFSDFQQLVASKCDEEFTSAGHLILDAIKTGTPPIDWSVSQLSSFQCCLDNVDCGLKLQMEDR
ncbi:hypothetical protein VP01_1626g1, partial [Puccinia sorghi]